MIEEWRQIPSFPVYEASSLGRIRSRFRVRKLGLDDDGYVTVSLYLGGKTFTKKVHVLVCEAFHGPKPAWAQVAAHNNGRKSNNRPDNVRWATHIGNCDDMVAHGTRVHGETHPRAIFTLPQVRSIRAHYAARPTGAEIARLADAFCCAKLTIRGIVTEKSWMKPQKRGVR